MKFIPWTALLSVVPGIRNIIRRHHASLLSESPYAWSLQPWRESAEHGSPTCNSTHEHSYALELFHSIGLYMLTSLRSFNISLAWQALAIATNCLTSALHVYCSTTATDCCSLGDEFSIIPQ